MVSTLACQARGRGFKSRRPRHYLGAEPWRNQGFRPLSFLATVTTTSGFDVGAWWGWVYHAGSNGSWVNAVSGNSGDITAN